MVMQPALLSPAARPPGPRALTLLLAAGFAGLEGYDLACYGVSVPSLVADTGLGASTGSAGLVGSLVAVGMMVGAALTAWLVVRLGSRRALFAGAGCFSVAMALCAVAPSFTVFGVGRFVVGIGLGVVLPTVTAYVAEIVPPQRRNRSVGLVLAGYAMGALVAPLLGAALLPVASWRWIYVIGALPVLALVPAAVRWLPVASPDRAARAVGGLRQLLAPGVRAGTFLFWAVSFCGLLLVFGVSTWLPTIMRASGYSLGSALLQTAVLWGGAVIGMIAGGVMADRFGSKPVIASFFVAGAASVLLLSGRPSLVLVTVLLFVSGLGLISSQALVSAYVVNRYPEHLRVAGIGWSLTLGRLGAIAGPLLGAAILTSGLGVAWNFYLFAAPALLGAVITVLVPVLRAESRREGTLPARLGA